MNCRPGDLAVIVASHPDNTENIGKLVMVLRRTARQGEAAGCDWLVRTCGGDLVGGGRATWTGKSDLAFSPDAWLRPIRGIREPEQVEHEATA